MVYKKKNFKVVFFIDFYNIIVNWAIFGSGLILTFLKVTNLDAQN